MRSINVGSGVLAIIIIAFTPCHAFVTTVKVVHGHALEMAAGASSDVEKAQIKSSDFQAVDPL